MAFAKEHFTQYATRRVRPAAGAKFDPSPAFRPGLAEPRHFFKLDVVFVHRRDAHPDVYLLGGKCLTRHFVHHPPCGLLI
jgi:hypothetical protein